MSVYSIILVIRYVPTLWDHSSVAVELDIDTTMNQITVKVTCKKLKKIFIPMNGPCITFPSIN